MASLIQFLTKTLTVGVTVIVICGIIFLANPTSAHAYSTNGVPVLYVHGFNPNAAIPGGCNAGSNFGTIRSYLQNTSGWTGSLVSLGYYNGDYNCDGYLSWESYRCTGWYPGNEGTTNEDLRHLSCELAWYIWDHYTVNGTPVKVIAHSLGGILIRQALNDTPYIPQLPPYITVEDVVTAGSPHQGVKPGSAFFVCNCWQIAQTELGNALMQNLNSVSFRGGFARNPQGNTGTDWTTMASDYDSTLNLGVFPLALETLGINRPIDHPAGLDGMMPGAKHFVVYSGPTPQYDHGDYLTDTNQDWSARVDYSDNNGGSWVQTTTMAHSIKTMAFAIGSLYW